MGMQDPRRPATEELSQSRLLFEWMGDLKKVVEASAATSSSENKQILANVSKIDTRVQILEERGVYVTQNNLSRSDRQDDRMDNIDKHLENTDAIVKELSVKVLALENSKSNAIAFWGGITGTLTALGGIITVILHHFGIV